MEPTSTTTTSNAFSFIGLEMMWMMTQANGTLLQPNRSAAFLTHRHAPRSHGDENYIHNVVAFIYYYYSVVVMCVRTVRHTPCFLFSFCVACIMQKINQISCGGELVRFVCVSSLLSMPTTHAPTSSAREIRNHKSPNRKWMLAVVVHWYCFDANLWQAPQRGLAIEYAI